MNALVAAFPMYDWPEARAQTDALWAAIRDRLRGQGIAAPDGLVRRNADLPAVPGGIRDGSGRAIAPDPATLPPDGLDLGVLWRHPKLLVAQTCWGPMERGLDAHVQVVGQPDYSAFEGGDGELYASAILIRRSLASSLPGGASRETDRGGGRQTGIPAPELGSAPAGKGEGEAPAPADGHAILPLGLLRGARLAYNGPDSMSGMLALTRDLDAAGESLSLFTECIETGGHRASIVAVAQGRADVCAVDCRSWAMARRLEPAARALQPVGWTARRKGLPFVTAGTAPPETVAALREAAVEAGMLAG